MNCTGHIVDEKSVIVSVLHAASAWLMRRMCAA